MTEVYELLRTKENELARVRKEIEALRTVSELLAEPDDIPDLRPGNDPETPVLLEAPLAEENALQDTSSPDSDEVLFHSKPPKRSRLRDWIGRAVGEQRQDSQGTSVA
jgi:hypothetical protein